MPSSCFGTSFVGVLSSSVGGSFVERPESPCPHASVVNKISWNQASILAHDLCFRLGIYCLVLLPTLHLVKPHTHPTLGAPTPPVPGLQVGIRGAFHFPALAKLALAAVTTQWPGTQNDKDSNPSGYHNGVDRLWCALAFSCHNHQLTHPTIILQ